MRDHPDETLRSKDPTREGRHLHEPDGFPHAMIGLLMFLVVIVALLIGALYVTSGPKSALVVAALFVLVGMPWLLVKMNRGAEHWRAVDQREEREVEVAEAIGAPKPKNSIEQINDKLNRSPYDETIPHTQAPGDVNRSVPRH
jgi:hypothetical protein